MVGLQKVGGLMTGMLGGNGELRVLVSEYSRLTKD